jgi:hypothetical protein
LKNSRNSGKQKVCIPQHIAEFEKKSFYKTLKCAKSDLNEKITVFERKGTFLAEQMKKMLKTNV